MAEFEFGDRVVVPEDAVWGSLHVGVDAHGPGEVRSGPDVDGDMWISLDSGEYQYCRESQLTQEDKNDPIRPNYYQLGAVEAIDLSEHLTSNGGQAVQYIVRSTRLDRVFKGSRVEDLKKAIWLAEREIKRIESEEA